MNYRPARFSYLPEVVKNLLIINGLFFLATYVLSSSFNFDLGQHLALHNWQSPDFKPHQLVTHLFMHGSLTHIFFNMFALWMFGNQLENVWGGKRFLIYFMLTGLGAALLHLGVNQLQISMLEAKMTAEQIGLVAQEGYAALMQGKNFIDPQMGELNALYHTPTVGASGAVFGVLLAFGMLFPNTLIYIYFAFPIKAKYFVMIYGAIELWSGLQNNPTDNVAHFAHLGGMIFGYLLIKHWRKNSQHFY
jgi:membrane associated rhomboid family serine protease